MNPPVASLPPPGKPVSLVRRIALRTLALGLPLSLALLAGCQTTARALKPVPGLTRASLETNRVVLAAVTALGGGEYIAADALAEVVVNNFVQVRPWLQFAPLAEARLAMTQNRHADLMKKVRETNRWTEQHLAALAPLTNVARYALVVDVARSRERRMEYSNYQDEYLRQGGMGGGLNYDVFSGGTRQVTLVFYLRDLHTQQTVWVASGTAVRRAVVRQSGYENLYRPAPPAGTPSVVEVSDSIARQAARQLPR